MKLSFGALSPLLALLLLAFAALFFLFLFAANTQAQVVTSQLRFGSRGAEVTALQQFLATDPSIYPEGLVTGYYGPLTAAAVQRYQCKMNIVCSGTAASTGYGQVGPRTLLSLNAGAPMGGADIAAPLMSGITTTVATASSGTTGNATISWTTSEPARHRVMYGTSYPFLYATAPSATDPSFGTSANVTLSGLTSGTVYHYVLESVDIAGNVMWTTARTFTAGTAATLTQ